MGPLLDKYLDEIQEVAPIMLAVSAASLSMTAFNLYKQHLTKAARACKDLTPREKSICMLRFKMSGKKLQLAKLKDGMTKCNKSKNPKSCKQSLVNKAKKVGEEIKFLAKRVEELRKQKH